MTLVAAAHRDGWYVYDTDARRVGRVRPGPHARYWAEVRTSAGGYSTVGHYDSPTEAGEAAVAASRRLRALRLAREEARRDLPAGRIDGARAG